MSSGHLLLSSPKGWVYRVLGYGFGVRGRIKVKSRDYPTCCPRATGHARMVLVSASTKSHASEKIRNPYFGNLRIASDADSESPHMM